MVEAKKEGFRQSPERYVTSYRNSRSEPEARATLLILTGGPYFWPFQRTARAKYELLSEDFDGFILSFVSRREWRRVRIGRFELIGRWISGRVYGSLPLRLLIRMVFTLVVGARLHFFRQRIQIIVACDPFVTGLLAYVLSRITGAKFIVEVNNDLQNVANWNVRSLTPLTYLKSRYVSVVAPFVMNRADAVRLLYPTQVSGFLNLRDPSKYVCVHDFVATGLFRPASAASKTVLFVGHPWYLKGVDLLVRAFAEVSPKYPEYTLSIVGYLPEKERHRGLYEGNSRVRFLGPVMPDEVIRLMGECYVFVLPSRSEGMPRVLIEAMAAGKPIIASKVGGVPYYIRHREIGLLFESEDVDALAKLMDEVLGNETYARSLGDSAQRHVKERLSDRCYGDTFRKIVTRALTGAG